MAGAWLQMFAGRPCGPTGVAAGLPGWLWWWWWHGCCCRCWVCCGGSPCGSSCWWHGVCGCVVKAQHRRQAEGLDHLVEVAQLGALQQGNMQCSKKEYYVRTEAADMWHIAADSTGEGCAALVGFGMKMRCLTQSVGRLAQLAAARKPVLIGPPLLLLTAMPR